MASLEASLFDFGKEKKPTSVSEASADQSGKSRNFFNALKSSPDGSCLLTNSEDAVLRIYEWPSDLLQQDDVPCVPPPRKLPIALQVKEAECVYDTCWYPAMSSAQPATCCFLTTSRDHPLHLWDAFTGTLRATYRSYNHVDEITAAFSISFNCDGTRIYCGYKNMIRTFETELAGREHKNKPTVITRRDRTGQRGILSTIAFCHDRSGLFAVGSFSRTVGLYDERGDSSPLYLLEGHTGGITQVLFSPDGQYLFSGARKDPYIQCWDIRNTGHILHTLQRTCTNNQRLFFDIEPSGRYLATSSQDGRILVYDWTASSEEALVVAIDEGGAGAVNATVFHPYAPLLASTSGDRRFDLPREYIDEDDISAPATSSLTIWRAYATRASWTPAPTYTQPYYALAETPQDMDLAPEISSDEPSHVIPETLQSTDEGGGTVVEMSSCLTGEVCAVEEEESH